MTTQGEHTYARGAELGCPDCLAEEPHCCPFLHADQLPEPQRSWALRHGRAMLADEYAEAAGSS